VKVAKKFLEDHPEEAGKYGQVKKSPPTGRDLMIGVKIISCFLGWNQHDVSDSLERLNLIPKYQKIGL